MARASVRFVASVEQPALDVSVLCEPLQESGKLAGFVAEFVAEFVYVAVEESGRVNESGE